MRLSLVTEYRERYFQIEEKKSVIDCHAYHPQTDGLVERFNGTLAQSLSMYVSKTKKTGIATFLWFYSRIEFLRRTSPVNRHFSLFMVAILDCPYIPACLPHGMSLPQLLNIADTLFRTSRISIYQTSE